jgi:hypothetical protein
MGLPEAEPGAPRIVSAHPPIAWEPESPFRALTLEYGRR